ncbi:hypothetical protein [Streptomyces asiaticus]|uniref:hypothetical protein n=1 Tax=Streptomyces asiaticus TaxID=114695 RepID=UPI0037FF7F7A
MTVTDGAMAYTAADGQTNKLTIKRVDETDTTLAFGVDDVVEITAGTDCTHPTATDLTYVTCSVPVPDPDHGGDQGNVELGDGNDSAEVSGGDVNVDGGTGDDTITDSFAVWARDGDNIVTSDDVANEIYGGPGDNVIDQDGSVPEGF